jgi:uncharacterized membrane protein
MSGYDSCLLLVMRIVAFVITVFVIIGLATQLLSDRTFFDRELTISEMGIVIAMVAFAWLLTLVARPWFGFVDKLTNRRD